jgi:Uma2 family endonuclease
MVQEAHRVRLTYDDLGLMPEDGRRHELVDGEHLVTPSPRTRHQRALVRLLVLLQTHLEEHGAGEAFPAPFDVVLSRFDVVEPDLVVVLNRSRSLVTEANVQGPPDLVVEILSPATAARDRGLKRKLYEKHGVSEYWLVDPDEESVEVLRLTNGRLTLAQKAVRIGRLTSPALPGLTIDLAALFSR